MVFNAAYGRIEDLPFDLRGRRVVVYHSAEEDSERSVARKKLAGVFEQALRAILQGDLLPASGEVVGQPSPLSKAISALESRSPARLSLVRKVVAGVFDTLRDLAPDLTGSGWRHNELVSALGRTDETVIGFAELVAVVAAHDDTEAALDIHRGFEQIAALYERHPTAAGTFYDGQFDFFKFLGQELFAVFVAILLRENRWSTISRVLSEDLVIDNVDGYKPGAVTYEYLSQPVRTLVARGRELGRVSVRADLLEQRYTRGRLAELVGWEWFMAADYLLFLRSALPPVEAPQHWPGWAPHSVLYMTRAPRYVYEAVRSLGAERLAAAVGLDSTVLLRERLAERAPIALAMFDIWHRTNPLGDFDLKMIGTR